MGITAAITGLVESLGVGAGAAGVIGTVGAGVLEGAALGAGTSALTGGDIGKGALLGGLTGGIGGGATSLLGSVGVGSTAANVLGGAIGGAGSAAITGGDIGKSALLGAGTGFLKTELGGSPSKGAAPTAGGGTASAAGTAAPASIGVASPDVTAATAGGTSLPGSGGGGAGLPGSVGAGAASAGGSAATSGISSGTQSGLGGAIDVSGPPITVTAPSNIETFGPTIASTTAQAAAGQYDKGSSETKKGGLVKTLASNPTLALSGVGLASSVLSGNKMPSEFQTLEAQAKRQQEQSQQMEGYLASGTLPPGIQTSINSATQAAEAAIKSRYATHGMSGSSAEAQDIQAARERAVSQGSQIAMQLFQQGMNEAQISDQIYSQLLSYHQEQDQQTSAAIGNFAAALAGMQQPLAA